jgi:hypothetical protein
MPNPTQSGKKAGESWAVGFLGAALKKIDGGKHSIEKAADGTASKKKKKKD